MHKPAPVTQKARQLRSQATDAERHLWQRLRGNQTGFAFRRQYPVGNYIADFACVAIKLLIELDGGQHADSRAYDDRRDQWLRDQGFLVMRFWNHSVFEETDAVVEAIWRKACELAGGGSPSQPPPQVGEA